MKRFFILALALAFVTVLAAGPAAAQAKKETFKYEDKKGVIKIKAGQPIHIACWMVVAGADASLGTDTKRGAEIAIADKGGKLLGHPIKLSVQDTGCNAEGGQAAATKLAADPTVVAAIGSNCSSEARPGAPILWKAGIATVSPSNTAPYLTDPKRGPDYDGYLRTAHNDKIQGAVAAEFAIKQLKVKKAATIHDGSVYAEQLQAVFAETFKKMGGTITSQEAVAPTDTDMRPVLTKIATGAPEFLYYPIFIAAGGHITRQVKEVKGLEKVCPDGSGRHFLHGLLQSRRRDGRRHVPFKPGFFGLRGRLQGFRGQASEEIRGKTDRPFPRPRVRRGPDDLRRHRKGGQEGPGWNPAYRETAASRRPLCHQEFEGIDGEPDL